MGRLAGRGVEAAWLGRKCTLEAGEKVDDTGHDLNPASLGVVDVGKQIQAMAGICQPSHKEG